MDDALLAETRRACAAGLRELQAVSDALPAGADETLSPVFAASGEKSDAVRLLREADERSGAGEFSAARWILLRNASRSLGRLPEQPVLDVVKEKLCREFQFFAQPLAAWIRQFDPPGYCYEIFTKMARLERFPAGLLDFEESGFPSSWLARVPRRDLLPLVRFLAFEMKGRGPYLFPHFAAPRGRILMREREWNQSILWIVRSMAMQPKIKGILSSAWFYCTETHRVTPHLRFAIEIFQQHGAFVTNIGLADRRAGFLEGSTERQHLYESGAYRPMETIVLWPRKNALAWAARQPA